MSFDATVVDNGHVVWQRLTAAEQADLLVNFPIRPGSVTIPGTTVLGEAVDPRFEKWLDQSYTLRHLLDNIDEDPTG